MKISVIGCGYLGAVHAAATAELAHDMVGNYVDAARIETLSKGGVPFHEPCFEAALRRALAAGRLLFHTSPVRPAPESAS